MDLLDTARKAANGSAVTKATKRAPKIDIPVSSSYTPGSGPPLPKLHLQPPNDSEAYIIERILLPPAGVAKDGRPLPKRMTYIVGWKNQPAARLLVPVMDILDYVSPFVFEQWEYDMEAKLDERRALLEIQKKQGKKRPGRPPKPHSSKIEPSVVATAESDLRRPKSRAMSLSTPTKRKIQEIEEDIIEDEGILQNQLQVDSAMVSSSGNSDVNEPVADAPSGGLTQLYGTGKDDSESDDESVSLVMPQETPLMSRTTQATVEVEESWLRQPSTEAARPRNASTPNSATGLQAKASAKLVTPKVDSVASEEEEWTVKRLEDMNEYIVEGRGRVRYFKVLWEGNWSPDKNPTWEPEKNLPKALVKEYLKKKAIEEKLKRLKKPNDTPSSLKQTKLAWPAAL